MSPLLLLLLLSWVIRFKSTVSETLRCVWDTYIHKRAAAAAAVIMKMSGCAGCFSNLLPTPLPRPPTPSAPVVMVVTHTTQLFYRN